MEFIMLDEAGLVEAQEAAVAAASGFLSSG